MQKIEELLQKYPIVLQLMRFAAIGVINTALDFAVLNYLTKTYDILAGVKLGSVNVIGFSLAVIQSYFWNKYWAFNSERVSLIKNFVRLMSVGALGAFVMLLIIYGASISASSIYFLGAFALLVIGQICIWFSEHFEMGTSTTSSTVQFAAFIIVSVIGLLINSALISVVSSYLVSHSLLSQNADLIPNIAKLVATFASLTWNFIGYKLLVFKK